MIKPLTNKKGSVTAVLYVGFMLLIFILIWGVGDLLLTTFYATSDTVLNNLNDSIDSDQFSKAYEQHTNIANNNGLAKRMMFYALIIVIVLSGLAMGYFWRTRQY